MKTEDEIYAMIEAIREKANDHHIFLNTPLVRDTILSHYETIINILNWVIDEPQGTMPKLEK